VSPFFRPSSVPPSRAQLGLIVLLVSISVLFLAACAAVLITRYQIARWEQSEGSAVPGGILASTLLMAGVSFSLHRSVRAVQRNQLSSAGRALRRGGGLALAFVALQALNCRSLLSPDPTPQQSLYLFSVYLLVGLHAAHVVGGVVPIGIVLGRLGREEYSSSRHEGLKLLAQYWHYLGLAWLVLLATMAFLH